VAVYIFPSQMVTFTSVVLFSLLTLSTLAAPVANTTTATNATVMTPAGARPVSNVFSIPEGGKIVHVGDEIHVVDASGTVIHINKNEVFTGSAPLDTHLVARGGGESGWIAFAFWTNQGSSPLSSFTATWTVPPPPPSYTGQTLFLFNSIQAPVYSGVGSSKAIIFPVLQYGVSAAGGGAYWAVASWYIVGSTVYHTSLVTVKVGQSLVGEMTWIGDIPGYSNNYAVYFSGLSSTTLFVWGTDVLTLATTALQGYTVLSDAGYPQSSMVFSSINLKTTAGVPSVNWLPDSDWTGYPETISVLCTINTQGATNAEVTIKVVK